MESFASVPSFEWSEDLFPRFDAAVDRLLWISCSISTPTLICAGGRSFGSSNGCTTAWTELKKLVRRRNARTIWRAVDRFEREVALFETELDSFEARLRTQIEAR